MVSRSFCPCNRVSSKWGQRLAHCRLPTCRQPALHEGHLLLPLQQGQGWVVQAVQQLVEHLVHGVVVACKQRHTPQVQRSGLLHTRMLAGTLSIQTTCIHEVDS